MQVIQVQSLYQGKQVGKTPWRRKYLDGPVVGNLPSSAGDVGSIPGQGTKVPLAPNLCSIARGPECCNED